MNRRSYEGEECRVVPRWSSGLNAVCGTGKGCGVGVSWNNFQEERWKRDEAAIKAALDKAGAKYISADAQGSNEKQLADVESLITRGANALIILAFDADAVLPAVQKAKAEGIPVIAYDRLIQDKDVLYITFDNVEVGRMQAREVLKVQPTGNYV
jgi:D-xylose transport system substrate-binding protein